MKKSNKSDPAILRQKAEASLKKKTAKPVAPLSEIDSLKLIHELEVHQIELEMQNEELMLAKERADMLTEKYTELNDFAPSGYFTLSHEGKIIELNLIASKMLGKDRSYLINSLFGLFVSKDSKPGFNLFLEKIFNSKARESCDVCLSANGNSLYVHLTGIICENADHCLVTGLDITERKLAEQALQESEERFRAIFEQAGIGMAILNTYTGQIVRINQKYCDFIGYTMQEMLQKTFMDITFHEDIQTNIDYNKQLLEGSNKEFSFEKRYMHKNGNILWGSLTVSPLWKPDEKPQTYFHIAIVENITERKEAKDDLSKELYFSKSLIETAQVIILTLNPDGTIFHFNPYMEELSGYKLEEVKGKDWVKTFIPEEIKQNINEIFGKAINNIPTRGNVNPIITKNKQKLFIEWYDKTLLDSQCRTIGVLAIGMDVTERMLAQDALIESEQKLKSITGAAQDAIIMIDYNGNVSFWNQSANNIFGYSQEEIVGKTLHKVIARNEDNMIHLKAFPVFAKSGTGAAVGKTLELIGLHKNGSEINIELSLSAIKIKDNWHAVGIARDITDRKKQEEKLSESEERYRMLVQQMPDMLSIHANGKFLYANDIILNNVGLTIEEIKGQSVLNFVTEPFRDMVLQNMKKRMSGEQVGEYEIEVIGKNETNRRVIVRSESIKYEQQNAILSVMTDITERKNLEIELQKNYDSQEVLVSLLKLSMENITLKEILYKSFEIIISLPWLAFESKGCIFLFNKKTQELEMFTEKNLSANIQNSCRNVKLEQCYCGKAAVTKQIVFSSCLDADHEIRYPDIHEHGHYCVPILFADQLLGVINIYLRNGHRESDREREFLTACANTLSGIIVRKDNENELNETLENLEKRVMERTSELTDEIVIRKEIENLLKKSEVKYRTLIEQAVDAIFIGDSKGNFIDVNDAAVILTGYTRKELMRSNMEDLFSNDILTATPLRYDLLDKGEIVITERILTQKNGMPIPIEMKTRKMPDGTYQAFLRDTTERKKMEKNIREALDKERELNLLKSRFISVISHEFRTPLSGIFGSVQLLEKHGSKWDDAKKQEYYKRIYSSIQYTNVLLDDVSIIGKDESGRLSANIQAVNVKKLYTQVICDLKSVYGKLVVIKTKNNYKSAEINTDESLLRHILNNIISNGIKYSENKPVDLLIEKYGLQGIQFSIHDRGIGIPAEDMKHIFKPFHRAVNAETIKGTGIGLTIVKRCVDLLQGTIEIESTEGKGTTVKVVLPVTVA